MTEKLDSWWSSVKVGDTIEFTNYVFPYRRTFAPIPITTKRTVVEKSDEGISMVVDGKKPSWLYRKNISKAEIGKPHQCDYSVVGKTLHLRNEFVRLKYKIVGEG